MPRDAHRLPENGVVLARSPLVPFAFLMGFMGLATALFVEANRNANTMDPLPGFLLLLVGCGVCPALFYFWGYRGLRAGPGWLATKKGWRWNVIHAEELVDPPAGKPLVYPMLDKRALSLYSSSTWMPISNVLLVCPEVHSAVTTLVGQATGISPGIDQIHGAPLHGRAGAGPL